MKHIINNLSILLLLTFGISVVCSSCSDDMKNYDNKAFTSSSKVGTILLKGTNDVEDAVIKTQIAKPEVTDVRVTYKADSSLVDEYNMIYGEQAIIVPSENYEISDDVSVIEAGAMEGNDVVVHFKNLSELDRDLVYVLPVTVGDSNIDFLKSTRTSYFVIKGAALINTVANVTNNYLALQNPGSSTLNNLSQLTIEALVRIDQFGKLISTVMGIEGNFLFRVGDAGVSDNQLQLATSNGNVTDASWQIPINEWVHIAATYSSTDGAVEFYLNGVRKGSTQYTSYRSSVNWASSSFYIGKSYDDTRWLEGDICEVRVWNRVLTVDEIKAKDHYYVVAPDSEGLVAYWRFDEGSGKVVADHTGNANTVVANADMRWDTVSLPQ
ncbi:DUF1735 and LamG domain-containing protein [uncultured Bacteroides sp.]|uniref:DUF1735 and LamG domain-containing protein n=1 Tax=uncultured Bacteroides sp. TaxID=162156 RepID=UPI002AA844FB|nr:DUF1735 and LamG domain-containing protein [uncultured Bacteroides sp.]